MAGHVARTKARAAKGASHNYALAHQVGYDAFVGQRHHHRLAGRIYGQRELAGTNMALF